MQQKAAVEKQKRSGEYERRRTDNGTAKTQHKLARTLARAPIFHKLGQKQQIRKRDRQRKQRREPACAPGGGRRGDGDEPHRRSEKNDKAEV